MTDHMTIIQNENLPIPNGSYNPTAALRMRRRRQYVITDDKLRVQRDYIVGGVRYQVHSIFDLSAKKTAMDDVRHLIDADLARNPNIQLTFPSVSSIVAVAEEYPRHTQSA